MSPGSVELIQVLSSSLSLLACVAEHDPQGAQDEGGGEAGRRGEGVDPELQGGRSVVAHRRHAGRQESSRSEGRALMVGWCAAGCAVQGGGGPAGAEERAAGPAGCRGQLQARAVSQWTACGRTESRVVSLMKACCVYRWPLQEEEGERRGPGGRGADGGRAGGGQEQESGRRGSAQKDGGREEAAGQVNISRRRRRRGIVDCSAQHGVSDDS